MANISLAMIFFRAEVQTRHFTFEAFAQTEADARRLLMKAWRTHCKRTGAKLDYVQSDDVQIDELRLGAAYCDRQELDLTGAGNAWGEKITLAPGEYLMWKDEGQTGPLYIVGKSGHRNFKDNTDSPKSAAMGGGYFAHWFTLREARKLASSLQVKLETC